MDGATERRGSQPSRQLVALALAVFLERGDMAAEFLAFPLNAQRRFPGQGLLGEAKSAIS
ncbi:MAG: hypothetical protein IPM07_15185 [Anaerolineales bacterium]|nr:hypothetical protein [Anaerolineales bacterium]